MAKPANLQMVVSLSYLIFARTSGGVRRDGQQGLAHDHRSLVRSDVAFQNSERGWFANHLGILAADPPVVAGPHPGQTKQTALVGGGEVHLSFLSYVAIGALIASIITLLYGSRGMAAVCGILVYLFSNSMMKLTMKLVFVTNNFKFPFCVTALHFAVGGLASLVVLLLRRKPFLLATRQEFFIMLVPIAVSIVVCVGAGNLSLVLCSAAFTEVIGSTTCLITVICVILSGLPFNWSQFFPAVLVTLGCAISSCGEMHFSPVGMIMCFVANIARSLKVTMQQKLMNGEVREKFDPCALLFWTCMPATVIMAAYSLAHEGLEPWHQAKAALQDSPSVFMKLCIAVFGSCANASILNMAQLVVTKDLGAVGSQIVAQSKTILTVLGGVTLFGESVTWLEAVGFGTVLVGVFLFSRAGEPEMTKRSPAK